MSETGTQFARDLVVLAERAVQFHANMSCNPELKEEFVRDWVATKLHEPGGYTVAIEVNHSEFRNHVADQTKVDRFDKLAHLYEVHRERFSVDMVVWSPEEMGDRPIALIELKRIRDATNDIERSARLLTCCRPEMRAYQLLCASESGKEPLDRSVRRAIEATLQMPHVHDEPTKGEPFNVLVEGKPSKTWAQIVIFPVSAAAA